MYDEEEYCVSQVTCSIFNIFLKTAEYTRSLFFPLKPALFL